MSKAKLPANAATVEPALHTPPRPTPVRQPRRYLRKTDLCIRYGWKTTLSVDRAWKLYGSLPPPTTWQVRSPLWAEDILDAHDAANALRETPRD